MLNTLRTIAALAAVLGLAGCGDTLDDPPDGALRYLNASPTLGSVEFRLVEVTRGEAVYAAATDSFVLDSGPFRFSAFGDDPASSGRILLTEQELSVTAGNELLLVLYDDTGAPAFRVYDTPLNVAAAGETVITPLHAAKGAAPVNIYVEADGADLTAATPRATLTFQELGDPFTVPTGDYRLSVTAANDPATVLFVSEIFTTTDASVVLAAVFAGAGTTRAPLRAGLLDQASPTPINLADSRAPVGLRAINGSDAAVDFFVNGDFTAPLHGAVAPFAVSDYADVVAGETDFQVTPAGNVGVIEVDQNFTLLVGSNQTQVIAGTAGAVTSTVYAEDNRGVRARTRFRVRNAAATFPLIDAYVTEPGTDITDLFPSFRGLAVTSVQLELAALGGDYEITLIENDGDADTEDTTVIAGPMPVTFENGRVYDVLIFDSATAGQADLLVIDSTAPQP